MIVLGADTHKRSHTIAAVAAATGELLGEQTIQVGRQGFAALLRWARSLDGEWVWALEDCRHVSGSLERFLIERGERVLRIPTHLSANARRSARQRGKSDAIDALGVARAALQEGLESFPAAQLDGPELDLRLLVDHRERLVRHRVELNIVCSARARRREIRVFHFFENSAPPGSRSSGHRSCRCHSSVLLSSTRWRTSRSR